MKKSNKKESASMSELLGILSYSERDTCFQLEGWGCLDIVLLKPLQFLFSGYQLIPTNGLLAGLQLVSDILNLLRTPFRHTHANQLKICRIAAIELLKLQVFILQINITNRLKITANHTNNIQTYHMIRPVGEKEAADEKIK